MQDTLIGQTLGKYRIIAWVAQGGMATVYRGVDEATGREVAIKVLLPAYSHDDEFVRRFQREAKAAAQLDHPNIVQIYGSGYEDGYHYIVMEYIEGGTLQDRLRKLKAGNRHLDVATTLTITRQIAEALHHAHQRNIVHRDIKPSNILLDGNRAVLSDLGIAKALAGTRLTKTMASIGTPEYMSPEQAQGRDVDRRTDIYSLGIVLYEMLTGRPPFQAEMPWAVVHQHIHETPPPVESLNPTITPPIREIVHRALAKDPRTRYPDAAAMARDIAAVMGVTEPAGAPLLEERPTMAVGQPSAVDAPPTVRRHVPGEPRGFSLAAVLIGALAIAGVLSAVFAFARGIGAPANTESEIAVVQPSSTWSTGAETAGRPTPNATSPPQTAAGAQTPAPTVTTIPTHAPSPTPTLAEPTPAVTAGRIVFATNRGGYSSLYLVNGDGTGLRKLTGGDFFDWEPTWSPDGQQILFVSTREGPGTDGLHLMNSNGTNVVRLSPPGGNDDTPVWVPGKAHILFASNRKGNWDIYEMDRDGSDRVRITDHPALDKFPVPSADGTRIAFISDRTGPQEIYVMNRDGSGARRLTIMPDAEKKSLDWSPDGQWIVFHAKFAESDHRLYLTRPDGTGLSLLAPRSGNPTWLPDSRHLIFDSDRDGIGKIYIMDVFGTEADVQQLTFGEGWDWSASWHQ